ncbi:chaplin [Streptomyces sp. MZ04]|uniref:chaplin n=1 Tax=Streptomyces sp. MZ04 TaxID=2559236 RepID=UPI00107E6967|nr:chaplin [Streptomyces sp. MZ04]TGB00508.1 chaplin [Streptomyces sp. MZ04]
MRKRAILAAAALAAVTVIGGAGSALADPGPGAFAEGRVENAPGVLNGNLVQAPVHAPINVCGNSGNLVGALDPAAGNSCE